MKKIFITLSLVAALLASLTACSTLQSPVDTPDTSVETTVDAETPDGDATVAKTLVEAFKTEATKEDATTNSIAAALSENEVVAFAPVVQDMEAGYLAGFDAEVDGFKSCTTLAPMIGTIPFVSYVFELAEDADVDAFATMLKDTHNLRWNICTAAEEMAVETEGNFVFFVMAPVSFETEETEEDTDLVEEDTDLIEDEMTEEVVEEIEEAVEEAAEDATEEVAEEVNTK